MTSIILNDRKCRTIKDAADKASSGDIIYVMPLYDQFINAEEVERREIMWEEIKAYPHGALGWLAPPTLANGTIDTFYGTPVATMKFCYHCDMQRGRQPEGECPQCLSTMLIERPEYDERQNHA
jgi:hypothetical protein